MGGTAGRPVGRADGRRGARPPAQPYGVVKMSPVADKPMPTSRPSTLAVSAWAPGSGAAAPAPAAEPQARPLASVSALTHASCRATTRGKLVRQPDSVSSDRVFDAQAGVLARELHGVHELARQALLAQGFVHARS